MFSKANTSALSSPILWDLGHVTDHACLLVCLWLEESHAFVNDVVLLVTFDRSEESSTETPQVKSRTGSLTGWKIAVFGPTILLGNCLLGDDIARYCPIGPLRSFNRSFTELPNLPLKNSKCQSVWFRNLSHDCYRTRDGTQVERRNFRHSCAGVRLA